MQGIMRTEKVAAYLNTSKVNSLFSGSKPSLFMILKQMSAFEYFVFQGRSNILEKLQLRIGI
jgi:hypothetical protein